MNTENYGLKPQNDIALQSGDIKSLLPKAAGLLIKALENDPDTTWENAQLNYNSVFESAYPLPEDVNIDKIKMGNVPAVLVTPKKQQVDTTMFYIHGGGYVSGSAMMYVNLAAKFALQLNAKIYIPDYRLAPEFPYPTPLQDVFEAYQWLVKSGCNTDKLTIAGDSAGGAIVITTMVKARNKGIKLPIAAIALSPWANLENNGRSMYNRNRLDPVVTKEILDAMAATFLNGIHPSDADASPVYADVRNLSPTLILIGENEVMLNDAIDLARHLAENRVRVNLEVWPGLFHVWPQYGPNLKESDQTIRNVVRFITDHME
ncbi:alpha/beta hydrolase [Chryseobacterium sp. Mn2064]|uniref:alpha/beta hydrolase n=1 Tax=Chryseobacterium sp. Mn2064 TaxID=3395263 RepID=UPI003BC14267